MTDEVTSQSPEMGTAHESWEVRKSGHNFDVCLPPEGGRVAVIATVFAGERIAHLLAAAQELYSAALRAADRFALLAKIEDACGRPESKGNAAIFRRDEAVLRAAISKAKGEA